MQKPLTNTTKTRRFFNHRRRSTSSILSIGSVGSILSIGSAGSILSIGSTGSILSIGSTGSILSIGSFVSVGSMLSFVSVGSLLCIFGRFQMAKINPPPGAKWLLSRLRSKERRL